MQQVNQVMDQAGLSANSVTPSTPAQTGERPEPPEETKQKAILFFSRLQTIYGAGRMRSLTKDERHFRQMRREWADRIGQLTLDQLEDAFRRLKDRLQAGDPDYEWPDIGRVLQLAQVSDKPKACHQVRSRSLPEPESVREQKRERGRSMMRHAMAVLEGREEPQTEGDQ